MAVIIDMSVIIPEESCPWAALSSLPLYPLFFMLFVRLFSCYAYSDTQIYIKTGSQSL